MKLHLYEKEITLLKDVLGRLKYHSPSLWEAMRTGILEKIEAEEERLEEVSHCSHEPAYYRGERWCCSKCWSYTLPYEGESWTKQEKYKEPHVPKFPLNPQQEMFNGEADRS